MNGRILWADGSNTHSKTTKPKVWSAVKWILVPIGPEWGIRLEVTNFYTLPRMRKGAHTTLLNEADS